MPAQAIAQCREAELAAQAIILQHVLVVTSRPDQVETNAITPPMRRAFEAGLEEAGELLAQLVAHGGHQCARTEMAAKQKIAGRRLMPSFGRHWHHPAADAFCSTGERRCGRIGPKDCGSARPGQSKGKA